MIVHTTEVKLWCVQPLKRYIYDVLFGMHNPPEDDYIAIGCSVFELS